MLNKEAIELRRNHLGSSDLPQIILNPDGTPVSPWGNPGAVYWSKVEPHESEGNASTELGDWLEGPLIEFAEKETGISFARNVFRVSPDNPIMAATHDGINVNKGVGCEAKYVSQAKAHEWGDAGTANVPLYVYLQVQHQCQVSALQRVVVPVVIAGYSLERRIFIVERDDGVIGAIAEQCRRFWNAHIIPRVPPTNYECPPIEVLKGRQRQAGKEIALDDALFIAVAGYQGHSEVIKKCEGYKEKYKNEIIDAMADADTGILPDGRKVTWKEHDVSRIDTTRLRKEQPEIAVQYTKVSKERRFNIEREKDGNRIGSEPRTELPVSSELAGQGRSLEADGKRIAQDDHAGTNGPRHADGITQESQAT